MPQTYEDMIIIKGERAAKVDPCSAASNPAGKLINTHMADDGKPLIDSCYSCICIYTAIAIYVCIYVYVCTVFVRLVVASCA